MVDMKFIFGVSRQSKLLQRVGSTTLYLGLWHVTTYSEGVGGKRLHFTLKLPHPQMEPRNEARMHIAGRKFIIAWGRL